MPISITLQADSFQELADLIRGIPLGNVQVTRITDQIELPLTVATLVPQVIPDAPAPQTTVDVEGKTWDAAIHSSSKALNADGTWRRKRGLKDEPAAPATPVAAMPHEVAQTPVAQTELNYGSVIAICGEKMKQGRLDAPTLGLIQLQYGLENLTQLTTRPDVIPEIYNHIAGL